MRLWRRHGGWALRRGWFRFFQRSGRFPKAQERQVRTNKKNPTGVKKVSYLSRKFREARKNYLACATQPGAQGGSHAHKPTVHLRVFKNTVKV